MDTAKHQPGFWLHGWRRHSCFFGRAHSQLGEAEKETEEITVQCDKHHVRSSTE